MSTDHDDDVSTSASRSGATQTCYFEFLPILNGIFDPHYTNDSEAPYEAGAHRCSAARRGECQTSANDVLGVVRIRV